MNNKKLSNLLLGSALFLGLGASVGSFAQQAETARMISRVTAIQSASHVGSLLNKQAAALIGASTFVATAETVAQLQKAIAANPQSEQALAFLKAMEDVVANEVPNFLSDAKGLRNFRNALGAFIMQAGYSEAQAQAAKAAINNFGRKLVGFDAPECIADFKDETARKIAALAFITMAETNTIEEYHNKLVTAAMAFYPGESYAEVDARLKAAFNTRLCDSSRGLQNPAGFAAR